MSGGYYDYAYSHLDSLANDIRGDCEKYETSGKDGHGWDYDAMPKDILDHMRFIAEEIKKLAKAAHDIEWLMSGDYGDDTLRYHCKSWELSKHLRA